MLNRSCWKTVSLGLCFLNQVLAKRLGDAVRLSFSIFDLGGIANLRGIGDREIPWLSRTLIGASAHEKPHRRLGIVKGRRNQEVHTGKLNRTS